jgi:bifunctional DNA-binding transcriptional regulator/antitoxin component of YhaV-PrlF toxin-antitoxin module
MTITVKNKKPLTIPDEVRRRAGFMPGDQVELRVSRGVVTILQAKRLVPRSPEDILTSEEAKKVRHALKQVREGKTTHWIQVKDELGL